MQDVMKESSWDILLKVRPIGVTTRDRKIIDSANVKVNECLGKQIRACRYEFDDEDVVSKPV